MRGDARGGDGGEARAPPGGMPGGCSVSSRLLTGKLSPGWCCRRDEPPRPILTLGLAGGAGSPRPHTRSGAAAAPRLGTSPRRDRPPTAPAPSPGKLRHDAKAQRSLSPPSPDDSPGPHAMPMSSVAGQQLWWPRWGLWDALWPERTRDTVHRQLPPAVWLPRTLSSPLAGVGTARHCCSPLLWPREACLGLWELGFAPCPAQQRGRTAPAPPGSPHCHRSVIFGHARSPRARSRCCDHIKKDSEVEMDVARGFTMARQPGVRPQGPHVSPPEPGAVPAARGRAGRVLLGGERGRGLLPWGPGWR